MSRIHANAAWASGFKMGIGSVYSLVEGKEAKVTIHSTAVVDHNACVHKDASIGPYAVISGPVRIGSGTIVEPFAYVLGFTEIGCNCRIHSHAVVGDLPQDLSFRGDESYCRVGDRTIIREGATIHRGTAPGTATEVGANCLIMANAHVAHNCVVGNHVTLVNGALLGGYVQVGERATVSGHAAIHQFVRVGELAMVSILAKVTRDVAPFVTTDRDGKCAGLNSVGLQRAGVDPDEREKLKQAYRLLFRSGLRMAESMAELSRLADSKVVRRLVDFLQTPSKRGVAGSARQLKVRAAA